MDSNSQNIQPLESSQHAQQTWAQVKGSLYWESSLTSRKMDQMRKDLRKLRKHMAFKPEEWVANIRQWIQKEQLISPQARDLV